MTLVVDIKYILLSFCRYNSNALTKLYNMSQSCFLFALAKEISLFLVFFPRETVIDCFSIDRQAWPYKAWT